MEVDCLILHAVLIAQCCGWGTDGKSGVSRNGDLTLDILNNYPTTVAFFLILS